MEERRFANSQALSPRLSLLRIRSITRPQRTTQKVGQFRDLRADFKAISSQSTERSTCSISTFPASRHSRWDATTSSVTDMQESDSLSPGNHLTTFDAPFGKIGLGICYDIVSRPMITPLTMFSGSRRWP